MSLLSLEKRHGATVEVDLCAACRAIWFDQYEDLQLAPGATLQLFGVISEPSASAGPIGESLACPRCRTRLLHTHDMQRTTRFEYWRCDAGHGRMMTFINFLRAKDFIRPLSPQQLAELRDNVQTVNCSNCAAPIDLGGDSVCRHCGSPISMLDLKQMARTIEQLQQAATGRPAAAPEASAPVPDSQPADVDALLRAFKAQRRDSPLSLIETGLGMLGDLLRARL
jgi:hypothetical protein